jgi:hypothetical protein
MLIEKPKSDTDVMELTETKRVGSANCMLQENEMAVAF